VQNLRNASEAEAVWFAKSGYSAGIFFYEVFNLRFASLKSLDTPSDFGFIRG
jgi:hypothetical protein